MNQSFGTQLSKSAFRLLSMLGADRPDTGPESETNSTNNDDVAALIAADLVTRTPEGRLTVTDAGRAHLMRAALARTATIDPFLGQHLELASSGEPTPYGHSTVTINQGESPLMWLARRKGRDGKPLIEPHQLQAGERLRSEFTRALLMPRTTSNWQASVARDRRNMDNSTFFSEAVIAARQRLRRALDKVGPEFSGLLLDICCFLKRLEDIERERVWPPRSAKIVLQLALDRLARHYGYGTQAKGNSHAELRTWLAPDAVFVSERE
jgi:uncharacterized protein DUF6456